MGNVIEYGNPKNKKRQILFVAMRIPYDNVKHAGGKTFHYYINSFVNNPDNEVTLIAKKHFDEEDVINRMNPNIRTLFVSTPRNIIKRLMAYAISINSKFNPFYPYGNELTKYIYIQIENRLKSLKTENYNPDIIVLEWTSMLLFIDRVKAYFPDAKYVASEHDVTFLKEQREMERAVGFKKIIKRIFYYNIKNRELNCINKCDFVVTHNHKDRDLLLSNDIAGKKVGVIAPFFDLHKERNWKGSAKNIIFYGAMDRLENELSAIWFIENVMPKIRDLNLKYIVIGNKPGEKLKKYASDNVVITGFVDDIKPYFAEALCMAAPIQAGAGVKVKILEAMSFGLPVLTNFIGIEGIPGRDTIEYLHCETAEEYEDAIRKILSGEVSTERISQNAFHMIHSTYNMEESFKQYSKKVYSLVE